MTRSDVELALGRIDLAAGDVGRQEDPVKKVHRARLIQPDKDRDKFVPLDPGVTERRLLLDPNVPQDGTPSGSEEGD